MSVSITTINHTTTKDNDFVVNNNWTITQYKNKKLKLLSDYCITASAGFFYNYKTSMYSVSRHKKHFHIDTDFQCIFMRIFSLSTFEGKYCLLYNLLHIWSKWVILDTLKTSVNNCTLYRSLTVETLLSVHFLCPHSVRLLLQSTKAYILIKGIPIRLENWIHNTLGVMDYHLDAFCVTNTNTQTKHCATRVFCIFFPQFLLVVFYFEGMVMVTF